MDADNLGLASGLAMLGIYMVSDLVELARAGLLHEMIVDAADRQLGSMPPMLLASILQWPPNESHGCRKPTLGRQQRSCE